MRLTLLENAAELDWGLVPERFRRGLELFVAHHVAPGGFLLAVLELNLIHAALRADCTVSMYHVAEILWWLEEHAPREAWGSPAKVRDWLARAAASS